MKMPSETAFPRAFVGSLFFEIAGGCVHRCVPVMSVAYWNNRRSNGKFNPKTHSHSIVAGGLLVMSYTTRLMPGTSATMRLEMRASTS